MNKQRHPSHKSFVYESDGFGPIQVDAEHFDGDPMSIRTLAKLFPEVLRDRNDAFRRSLYDWEVASPLSDDLTWEEQSEIAAFVALLDDNTGTFIDQYHFYGNAIHPAYGPIKWEIMTCPERFDTGYEVRMTVVWSGQWDNAGNGLSV